MNTFHTGKLLDGYALSTTDGYTFVTPWLDLHSAHYFSMTAVITGGTVSGTFTLEQSNDRQSGNSNGIYPFTTTSATGTPSDKVAVPSGTGQQTMAASASGVVGVINQFNIGYRWARLSYLTATKNQTGTVDVFYHWKH